jgi:hypothetical protein
MAKLDTSLSSPDLKRVVSTLRTIDKGIATEWRQKAKREIAIPWANDLARFAPAGSRGAAAGRSIKPGVGPLPVIRAGVGSWSGAGGGKPFQPFFSTNFGMGRAYHTYIRKNRSGLGNHIVKRRVGTWAPVHVGSYSYWLDDGFKQTNDKYRARVIDLLDDYLQEVL